MHFENKKIANGLCCYLSFPKELYICSFRKHKMQGTCGHPKDSIIQITLVLLQYSWL